jgi:hypothetical protein
MKKIRPILVYNIGRTNMTTNQLERLRRDSREIKHSIQRMKNKGKLDRLRPMKMKQDYIDAEIYELELRYLQTA